MQYDLDLRALTSGQGHALCLGHGQQYCEILSNYIYVVESYDPYKNFSAQVQDDLDLGGMTLGQGKELSLGRGLHYCKISKSVRTVKSCNPD